MRRLRQRRLGGGGLLLSLHLVACGESPSDGPKDAGAPVPPTRLDASCPVTVESPPLLDSPHVSRSTPIQFNSNPPASGPHDPVWADFREYATPVDRRFWLHTVEHGAIAFLYKCEGDGGCPSIVEGLRRAAEAIPKDARCTTVRARTLIAPDPLLDVPVAAVAWGWTYKAQCVDLPTLTQFAIDHYAKSPEDICLPGVTTF